MADRHLVERHHIDLSNMSDGDVILAFKDFASHCERHPAFKSGFPSCVPGPPLYYDLAESMTQIVMGGPQDKIAEQQKQEIRYRGARSMTFTSQYIVMFADHHNAPSMVNELGLELVRRPAYKKGRQIPPMPSKFQVKDAEEPGAIHISVSNRPSKGSVEVQVNEVSPSSQESWRRLGNYYECRFISRGLDSVKRYYVRVRFETSAGPGPWSEVLTIVVS